MIASPLRAVARPLASPNSQGARGDRANLKNLAGRGAAAPPIFLLLVSGVLRNFITSGRKIILYLPTRELVKWAGIAAGSLRIWAFSPMVTTPGRRSSAALVAPASGPTRLSPPPDLTDEKARRFFLDLVAASKSEHFQPVDSPLLALFCRMLAQAERATEAIAKDSGRGFPGAVAGAGAGCEGRCTT